MREGVIPRLPRQVWVVLAADLLPAVGSGLTLPFLLVYLNRVHGFSLELAGVAIAVLAVASLVGNPVGGWLADRVGPRAALSLGLAIAGGGAAGLAVMSAPWHGSGPAPAVAGADVRRTEIARARGPDPARERRTHAPDAQPVPPQPRPRVHLRRDGAGAG
jgi:hypothetical protein